MSTPDTPGAGTAPDAPGAGTAPDAPGAGTAPDAPGAARPSGQPRGKSAKPAIACTRLTKAYGDTTVVSQLNLTVGRGEIFGLLGPNGAGKTTTILMLLGLTEPTSGTVRVLGLNPATQSLDVKRRVGYLPDSVGFYTAMTGRQNLHYTARLNGLRGRAAADRVAEVLDVVGMAARADDRVDAYSRGMTQRLGIADALIKDPEVLILDEPTVGLDPHAAESVLATIRSLASEHGVTVLLSSHLLTQVQATCHRIGIFVRGSLVAAGSIDELAATRGGRIAIEVEARGGDPAPILKRLADVVDVRPDGDGFVVGAQSDVREQIATQLSRAGFVITHLRQRPEELGAIYRRYFAEDRHDAA